MRLRAVVGVLLAVVGLAAPAAAQPAGNQSTSRAIVTHEQAPSITLRPFVMGSEQAFAAASTFAGAFGGSRQRFLGGGLQVVFNNQFYAEVAASRFRRTGERAFFYNGQSYPLGLPLTAAIKPLEITGGYRFRASPDPVVLPYAGAGLGWYSYEETSPSSDTSENLQATHRGFVLTGGAEFKLHRWVRLAADVQYTHVPGILGLGGVSQAAGEDDLGGLAARLKIIVGR
jgi:hypothetical protein